jgi:hypothetical protein
MRTYTIKLIDLIEGHKQEIAKQWYHYVEKNPRTKSFLDHPESEMISIAAEIYGSFQELFFSENRKETAKKIFGEYAEKVYRKGIPPHEAIYALILMRRHIWFYAEFKTVFISVLEHYQKEESLNRIILIFDYAFYTIVEKYEELRRSGK